MGLAISALVLASACGASNDSDGTSGASVPLSTASPGVPADTVSAAKKEGAVYVYSDIPESAQDALTKAFNARYPEIKVTFDRRAGLTTVVPAQVSSGKKIGDMYLTGGDISWIETNAAILTPITSSEAKTPTWTPYVLDKGLGVQFYFAPNVIAWNKTTVPDGIKSLDALATRKSDLKIGMADPNLSTGVRGILIQTTKSLGDDWLNKAVQGAKLYSSSSALAQGLASGEIDIAWPVLGVYFVKLKAQGAPIDSVVQDPPTSTRASETILASAPHPNAAQLFADFILSQSGQQASAAGILSPYPNLPGTAGTAKPSDRAADLVGVSETDQSAFLQKFKDAAGS